MNDYDCQSCGACCIPTCNDDRFVELSRIDYMQLESPRRNLLVVSEDTLCGPRRCLRTKPTPRSGVAICVCIALAGDPGNHVSCLIYDQRPVACRLFGPGSEVCKFARTEIGLPVKPRHGVVSKANI